MSMTITVISREHRNDILTDVTPTRTVLQDREMAFWW